MAAPPDAIVMNVRKALGVMFAVVGVLLGAACLLLAATRLMNGTLLQRAAIVIYGFASAACFLQARHLFTSTPAERSDAAGDAPRPL